VLYIVRFEIFTAVTMKNAVFWDVAPCISCVNRRLGGTYRLHLQGRKIVERGTSVSRWLQTEPAVENTQLYKNRKGTWEIIREERGRVSGDGPTGSGPDRVGGWERGRVIERALTQ
jgi:hypothetical protein